MPTPSGWIYIGKHKETDEEKQKGEQTKASNDAALKGVQDATKMLVSSKKDQGKQLLALAKQQAEQQLLIYAPQIIAAFNSILPIIGTPLAMGVIGLVEGMLAAVPGAATGEVNMGGTGS